MMLIAFRVAVFVVVAYALLKVWSRFWRRVPRPYALAVAAFIVCVVAIAGAIGGMLETGFPDANPELIRSRAVTQLVTMMKSDPDHLAAHGLTTSNLRAYIALVDSVAQQTVDGAKRGELGPAHSVDVNYPLARPNLLPDGAFENDSNRDGIADGWTLDAPPPPGMTRGLDAVRAQEGKFAQRITIAKSGASSRRLMHEVSVRPVV